MFETDLSGNFKFRHIYFNGRRTSRQEASNWMDNYVLDRLGNARYVYGLNGSPDVSDYYPFGGERPYSSAARNKFKFTGKERDSETNLDHAMFRQYASSFGRWTTSDPADLAAACIKNPQTQNRYAYVTNNPSNKVDPLGLFGEDGGGSGCPWWDPFCGGSPFPGGGGGSGGGPIGGPSETPKTTLQLITPDFWNEPSSKSVGSRWSCLNTDSDSKPTWGFCNYQCKRIGYAKGAANWAYAPITMGQLRRSCGWKASTCPEGVTLSAPEVELDPLLFGMKIESCTAGGMALVP